MTDVANLPVPSTDFAYCNHHHELTEFHQLVDFGDGEFVANIRAIPLLKALNELGLRTRTHHIDDSQFAFISILMDGVDFEIRRVNESCPARTKYNGQWEILLKWEPPAAQKNGEPDQ